MWGRVSINNAIRDVASTVDGMKQSSEDFNKNVGELKGFNERFKALVDQVIRLQEEAVSQRTAAVGPIQAGSQENGTINDEQNWEEFRAIWKRNNQRLETAINERLSGAKQRKYDNYPRTNYPAIIDRLFQDGALGPTAHEKSKELHQMFMSYKPRNRPVTDSVVGAARLLDDQLAHLIDPQQEAAGDGCKTDKPTLAAPPESQNRGDLASANAEDTDGPSDRRPGA